MTIDMHAALIVTGHRGRGIRRKEETNSACMDIALGVSEHSEHVGVC